jgi:uncharacterized SAM-binding protein YcdF (DUF218 family)
MRFLQSLLEPAALLGWLLLVLLVVLWRGRRVVWPRRLTTGLVLLYWLLASPLGANALLAPLERQALEAAQACQKGRGAELEWGILLAGGASDGARSEEDYAHLQQASFRRLIGAAQWVKTDPGRRLLVSGGAGSVPEAVLMGRLLRDLGVPREALLLESQTRTTSTGAAAVASLLELRQVKHALLFTSASHLPRAQRNLASVGIETCAMPVDFQHVAPIWPGHLVPQLSALAKSTAALHEYLGLLLRSG